MNKGNERYITRDKRNNDSVDTDHQYDNKTDVEDKEKKNNEKAITKADFDYHNYGFITRTILQFRKKKTGNSHRDFSDSLYFFRIKNSVCNKNLIYR